MYACGFRIYFTPLPGFFSPFPHGTCSLSVDHEYLALEDGPPMFRQDFSCPALLVARLDPPAHFHVRGSHPLRPTFPGRSINRLVYACRLLPFRSPLLGESRLISVPRGTEMFQFSRFATSHLCIQCGLPLHTTLSITPLFAKGGFWRYAPKAFTSPFAKGGLLATRLRAPPKAFYEGVGFPIRTSRDQSSFANSPTLFAGLHVLLRL